jgi:hypothetical protein
VTLRANISRWGGGGEAEGEGEGEGKEGVSETVEICVSVGDGGCAAGMEKALLGLRRGQRCKLELEHPQTMSFFGDHAKSAEREVWHFEVLDIFEANRKGASQQLWMAARRKEMATTFFNQVCLCRPLLRLQLSAVDGAVAVLH